MTEDAPLITHIMRVCHFGETKSTKNAGPERNGPTKNKTLLQMSIAGQRSKSVSRKMQPRLSRETAALVKPAKKSRKTRTKIFALMIAIETEHSTRKA